MWCLSVRVSVTFVSTVKMNKHIIESFSLSGSHTILVFPCKTALQNSDWNPPNGASNAGGVGRNRDSESISGFCLLLTLPQASVVNTVTGGPWPPGPRPSYHKLTLIAGSKRQSLLMAGRNVYDKNPKTTEQRI